MSADAAVTGLLQAGWARQDLADFRGAQQLFTQALAAARGLSNASNNRARREAQALRARGSAYRAQGRLREAQAVLEAALGVAEATCGPASVEVAYVLNELGIVGKFAGRFDDAQQRYRRALGILVDTRGSENHSDVASAYHNLAGLEHARGNYQAAEPLARRAVNIRCRALGPDHVHVAADRAALAAILDARGRHDQAERLLRDALRVFEAHYGPDQYEVAVTLNNLAAIAERRGDLPQAEAAYRRALAIKMTLLGPDSPETGNTLNNLAVLRRRQGGLADAEQLYRRALGAFRAELEPTHPNIATAAGNLAKLLRASGRTAEAAIVHDRHGLPAPALTSQGTNHPPWRLPAPCGAAPAQPGNQTTFPPDPDKETTRPTKPGRDTTTARPGCHGPRRHRPPKTQRTAQMAENIERRDRNELLELTADEGPEPHDDEPASDPEKEAGGHEPQMQTARMAASDDMETKGMTLQHNETVVVDDLA